MTNTVLNRPDTIEQDVAYQPKILVVDDDLLQVTLISQQLAMLGFSDVSTACEGRAAINEISRTPFNVVMSDLKMPGIDGIELLRYLAKVDHSPSVILMSGVDSSVMASVEQLVKAHRLDLLGTVAKPTDPSRVKSLIERAQQQSSRRADQGPGRSLSAAEVEHGLQESRIRMVLQPKVRIDDMRVVGVEALARWRLDDGTMLGPANFMKIVEDNGLMQLMTSAVIHSTLALMAGCSVLANRKVSINVSIDDLDDVEFADILMTKAEAAGIPLNRLILEVTESKVIDDRTGPLEVLNRLRMNGVQLSLDDFGTGASGFEKLQMLPFDELKIDRSFVHGAAGDSVRRTILNSILSVAATLQMSTVAEGVECEADWNVLAEMGCDVVQGYYVSRPMTPDQFVHWLAAHNRRWGLPD